MEEAFVFAGIAIAFAVGLLVGPSLQSNNSAIRIFNSTLQGSTIMSLDGNTCTINGVTYKQVLKLTIETTEEKIEDPLKYSDLKITIDGDCKQPITVGCGDVTVNGTAGNVKTSAGRITVTGNSGSVHTSQGRIEIGGNVSSDVKTSQGNITIKGDCHGSVKTSMGNINHGRSRLY